MDSVNPDGNVTPTADTQASPESAYAALANDIIDEVDSAEQPKAEQPEDGQVTEEAQSEDEAPEDADAEAGELVDFEIDGKVKRVDKEFIPFLLREADYRKKTADVAREREYVEIQLQGTRAIMTAAQQYPHLVAQANSAQAEYTRLVNDLARVKVQEPDNFANHVAEMQVAEMNVRNAQSQLSSVITGMTNVDAQMLAQAQSVAHKELSGDGKWSIKGWNKQIADEVSTFWANEGLPIERLKRVSSALEVAVLHDAMKYRQLKAAQPKTKQVSNASPTIAPKAQTVLNKGSVNTVAAQTVNSFRKAPTKEGLRRLIAMDL